jgi:hypothetical protein
MEGADRLPYGPLALITEMRLKAYSWAEIARKLKWSISTLWRWRVSVRFQEPLRIAPLKEIIEIVRLYIIERRRRGEVLLMGHIRGKKHRIWISMADLRIIINAVSFNVSYSLTFWKILPSSIMLPYLLLL